MATFTSKATGNWNATGQTTWNEVGYPVAGDDVTITASHVVTINVASACRSLVVNGSIVQNADLTLDDASTAAITFGTAGGWSSNGTGASPRAISSASATPTNPWVVWCATVAGADSRTINFDYVRFSGNLPILGNSSYYQRFNASGDDQPKLTRVSPLTRDPKLVEHGIARRNTGKVYPDGGSAGTVVLVGSCSLDSWMPTTVKDIIASGQRISLFTTHTHVPKCYIERVSFTPRAGLYMDFSITVREDT